HHLRAISDAGKESGLVREREFERALVTPAETRVAGDAGQFEPCECGFQLIAPGRTRPRGLIRPGGFRGQRQNRMNRVSGEEVASHSMAATNRRIQQFVIPLFTPKREETTNDNSRIKKVSKGVWRRAICRVLKRKAGEIRIPRRAV